MTTGRRSTRVDETREKDEFNRMRLVAGIEKSRQIVEVQGWADATAADGDWDHRHRRHTAEVARLRAIPYPWEKPAA